MIDAVSSSKHQTETIPKILEQAAKMEMQVECGRLLKKICSIDHTRHFKKEFDTLKNTNDLKALEKLEKTLKEDADTVEQRIEKHTKEAAEEHNRNTLLDKLEALHKTTEEKNYLFKHCEGDLNLVSVRGWITSLTLLGWQS